MIRYAQVRAPLPGRGSVTLLLICVVGLLALWALGLGPGGLLPDGPGLRVAGRFFSAALSPALSHEGPVPVGAPAFLPRLAGAILRTLAFAAAAMSLALPVGLLLGCLASDALGDRGSSGFIRAAALLRHPVRVLIALLRSIHEFLWAVVLLAAMGLHPLAGVVALAIPFSGVLAKVFSEMIDEAPRRSAHALQSAGARPLAAFLWGQLPRAAPDMAAYAFYRFECAVRSSVVLGFFGYPTLGFYLARSFENLHFHEVWTFLYAMGALVLALELWSTHLRRRLVG